MLKKLILLSIICLNVSYSSTNTVDSKRFIIATDLDDVLLQKDLWQMTSNVANNKMAMLYYLNLTRTYREPGKSFTRTSGENLYIKELIKNNNTETVETSFVRLMAQSKKCMPETLACYQQLRDLGVTFFTATNIGSIFFGDLQQKFPEVFNEQFIKKGLTVDYAATDVIEKPDCRYFELLKQTIDPHNEAITIFIDDKLDNVKAAQKCGLIAIHFKNAGQLRSELEKILNVPLTPQAITTQQDVNQT